jgi:hypothetical protein
MLRKLRRADNGLGQLGLGETGDGLPTIKLFSDVW